MDIQELQTQSNEIVEEKGTQFNSEKLNDEEYSISASKESSPILLT